MRDHSPRIQHGVLFMRPQLSPPTPARIIHISAFIGVDAVRTDTSMHMSMQAWLAMDTLRRACTGLRVRLTTVRPAGRSRLSLRVLPVQHHPAWIYNRVHVQYLRVNSPTTASSVHCGKCSRHACGHVCRHERRRVYGRCAWTCALIRASTCV